VWLSQATAPPDDLYASSICGVNCTPGQQQAAAGVAASGSACRGNACSCRWQLQMVSHQRTSPQLSTACAADHEAGPPPPPILPSWPAAAWRELSNNARAQFVWPQPGAPKVGRQPPHAVEQPCPASAPPLADAPAHTMPSPCTVHGFPTGPQPQAAAPLRGPAPAAHLLPVSVAHPPGAWCFWRSWGEEEGGARVMPSPREGGRARWK